MKKIMFSDKYGLTQSVLEGRKTQTRRIIKSLNDAYNIDSIEVGIDSHGKIYFLPYIEGKPTQDIYPTYQLEEVAVAQSYSEIQGYLPQDPTGLDTSDGIDNFSYHDYSKDAGWSNKMFTKPELMPYRIRITNIRAERLQDVEHHWTDCLCEGVELDTKAPKGKNFYIEEEGLKKFYPSATSAFAALIDKTCGKGTWQSNPWVFVYDFELIK